MLTPSRVSLRGTRAGKGRGNRREGGGGREVGEDGGIREGRGGSRGEGRRGNPGGGTQRWKKEGNTIRGMGEEGFDSVPGARG